MYRSTILLASASLFAGGFTLLPVQPEDGAVVTHIADAAPLSSYLGDTEPKCTLEYVDGAWVWVCYN